MISARLYRTSALILAAALGIALLAPGACGTLKPMHFALLTIAVLPAAWLFAARFARAGAEG